MINFGNVPAGAVLPIFFGSHDGTTGASEALSGLAVTDIEIYKDGSITQRASDAGYTLLDTDGIDVDGLVGINGFTIDTGDNTDSGFFAVGSFYTVVVASVTIDAQTVNFVAATFRITLAEATAGVPSVNTVRVGNTAQTAGDLAALITAVDDIVDTEVGAIKTVVDAIQAKTDALPSDPADASVIAALIATLQSTADGIDAKTTNLPSDPADASDVADAFSTLTALLPASFATRFLEKWRRLHLDGGNPVVENKDTSTFAGITLTRVTTNEGAANQETTTTRS